MITKAAGLVLVERHHGHSGATLELDGADSTAEPLTLNGSGFDGQVHVSWDNGSAVTLSGALSVGSGTVINVSGNGSLTSSTGSVSAGVSGSGGLTKIGTGSADSAESGDLHGGHDNRCGCSDAELDRDNQWRVEEYVQRDDLPRAPDSELDNTTAFDSLRLPDDAPITLNGGEFTFIPRSVANLASAETFGDLSLACGWLDHQCGQRDHQYGYDGPELRYADSHCRGRRSTLLQRIWVATSCASQDRRVTRSRFPVPCRVR